MVGVKGWWGLGVAGVKVWWGSRVGGGIGMVEVQGMVGGSRGGLGLGVVGSGE